MSEENPEPDLSKFKMLTVSTEEMDYLSQRWELQDHREIFSWGIKLLYDLSKADEGGWRLALIKGEFDLKNKQWSRNPEYIDLVFLLEWFAPTEEYWPRLPTIEMLEKASKIKKEEEKQ